jgi:hypothetical protein
MSFLKVNHRVGVALVALAMLAATCPQALANTISLECSYDGYTYRSPFAVDVDTDKSTVTINSPGENIGGSYKAPTVVGPYVAVIDDKTISWHWANTLAAATGDTSINRMNGKAIDTVHQSGQTIRVFWSCHAAQKQF